MTDKKNELKRNSGGKLELPQIFVISGLDSLFTFDENGEQISEETYNFKKKSKLLGNVSFDLGKSWNDSNKSIDC